MPAGCTIHPDDLESIAVSFQFIDEAIEGVSSLMAINGEMQALSSEHSIIHPFIALKEQLRPDVEQFRESSPIAGGSIINRIFTIGKGENEPTWDEKAAFEEAPQETTKGTVATT
jgi:hypothetical protein